MLKNKNSTIDLIANVKYSKIFYNSQKYLIHFQILLYIKTLDKTKFSEVNIWESYSTYLYTLANILNVYLQCILNQCNLRRNLDTFYLQRNTGHPDNFLDTVGNNSLRHSLAQDNLVAKKYKRVFEFTAQFT